jgi:large subunit ribosomal protein L17
MCFIELVDYNENMAKTQAKKTRRSRSAKKADAPVAEAAVATEESTPAVAE